MTDTTPTEPICKSTLPCTPPPEWEFHTWFPHPDGGGDMVRGERQRGVLVRRRVSYGDWEPVRPDRWAAEPESDVTAAAPPAPAVLSGRALHDRVTEAPADTTGGLVPRVARPLDIEHDELMDRAAAEYQARTAAEEARQTADRASVLREEADRIDATRESFPIAVQNGITWATAELRRHAAETQPPAVSTADRAAELGLTDTEYRARSHKAAVAAVRAAIPGMYADVGFRVEDALNAAAETQQTQTETRCPHGCDVSRCPCLACEAEQDDATETRPPTVAWKIETPLRGEWRHTGATYDDHAWATERYQDTIENDPDREFRLVRATTTYTVETAHNPDAEPAPRREPHPTEADVRHAVAVLAEFQGRAAVPAVPVEAAADDEETDQ